MVLLDAPGTECSGSSVVARADAPWSVCERGHTHEMGHIRNPGPLSHLGGVQGEGVLEDFVETRGEFRRA
jgi:hypothetical protein